MHNQTIRDLITKLKQELSKSNQPDPSALELLNSLERKISDEEETSMQTPIVEAREEDSFADQLKSLEAGFAASHPVAERTLREIIEILGKMGI